MSRGPSGRIVIEMDPSIKQQLHSALALEGKTLKDWFLNCAKDYLSNANQLPMQYTENEKEYDV